MDVLRADELREETSCCDSFGLLESLAEEEGVQLEKGLAVLPDRPSFTCDVIGGVLTDLGEDDFAQLRETACGLLSGSQLRFGEIFAGTDFSWHLFMEFLRMASGIEPTLDKWSHAMAVEHVGWKREFIKANNPNLVNLFGDAEDLHLGRAHCFMQCREVRVPRCDVLAAGFSCRSFSRKRANRKEEDFSRAFLVDLGTSGKTCRQLLHYVGTYRPTILIIENVVGLLRGYQKRNIVDDAVVDVHSNFHFLLSTLQSWGYTTPCAVLDSQNRLACSRQRAWLPCCLLSDTRQNARCAISDAIKELMQDLQKDTAEKLPLHRVLLTGGEEFEFWQKQANEGRSGIGAKTRTKYKHQHRRMYEQQGLRYPPAFSDDLMSLIASCRLTQREAEMIHYFDRIVPMDTVIDDELFLDLNDSLARQVKHMKIIPCICPKSRVWKRRQRSWLLVPEILRAQGFDMSFAPASRSFAHSKMVDLLGNSFNAVSFVVAVASALARTPELVSSVACGVPSSAVFFSGDLTEAFLALAQIEP